MKPRLPIVAFALTLAVLALSGCWPWDHWTTSAPVAPQSAPAAPAPDSPANAVRRLAWCWEHRDIAAYNETFTADFAFKYAPNDSVANPDPLAPWGYADEMQCALHLFVGGGLRPPASAITCTMGDSLVALPDPRPGMGARCHRSIVTAVDLKVTVIDSAGAPTLFAIAGHELFYLVRGDSAVIPAELGARGFGPDSTRWWVERWYDETASSLVPALVGPGRQGGRSAMPSRTYSLYDLKLLYRPSAPVQTPARAGR